MGFSAVGVIIVAMLGVGVAESAGLVTALIRKLVLIAPPKALTYILVFVGIVSSIAADAGYLVLIPLGAAAYLSVGRHPLAGLAATFSAVAAVFSVNIFVKPLDGMLVGVTNDAIRILNPNLSISSDLEPLVRHRLGPGDDGRRLARQRPDHRAAARQVHGRGRGRGEGNHVGGGGARGSSTRSGASSACWPSLR